LVKAGCAELARVGPPPAGDQTDAPTGPLPLPGWRGQTDSGGRSHGRPGEPPPKFSHPSPQLQHPTLSFYPHSPTQNTSRPAGASAPGLGGAVASLQPGGRFMKNIRAWWHKIRQSFPGRPSRRDRRSWRPQVELLERREVLSGSRVVLISLDGAKPDLIDQYL